MKISTKLFLSAALTTLLVLAISGVLFFTSQRWNKTFKENETIHLLVRGMFQLNMLSHNYLNTHVDRAKEQWRLKHGSIKRLLKNTVFEIPQEQALLEIIIESHADSDFLFSKLVEVYEGRTPGLEDALTAEVEKRLIGQLSVKLHSMVSTSELLDGEIHTRLLRAAQRTGWLVLFLVVIIAVITIIASHLLARAILKPIIRLQKDMEIIGNGNLNYNIETSAEDEIGQLGQAFNLMTKNLKKITVSHNELAKEIRERKRVEESLRDREAELTETNEKLSRTVRELELRTNEILLFNKLGDLLQACMSEEETFSVVTHICRQLFPLDSGYLSIIDGSCKVLRVVASWGDTQLEYMEFEHNQCWAIRRGKIHLVYNSEFGPFCQHFSDIPEYGSLCAPMSAQGEVVGMMHLCFGPGNVDQPEKERNQTFESKRMLVTSLIERYAPSLFNLRLRETLRMQSVRDPLTGLYNRRYLEEAFEREAHRTKRRNTSVGIIMIDVDHFKAFNDKYGHAAGDVVLCELGAFLQKSIRGEDIPCRYGGEEFMLIMPEASLESVLRRAQKLLKGVKEDIRIKYLGENLDITVSIGVALFPENGSTAEDVFKSADVALYRAKDEGRDRVVVAVSGDRLAT